MPKTTRQEQAPCVFIGVDPGQQGGLVAICKGVVGYAPMPETDRDVWEWFDEWTAAGLMSVARAVIEKVHSMPKQGIASAFTFGAGYGALRMALTAARIPFEEVTPQAWQKALAIPKCAKTESKPQFKMRLRAKAQQLFPTLPIWSEPKSKGRQLAIADALLIAEFCRRKHEGGQ
jgi:crossover junction endodeoxyribonuclease RuvC